MPTYPRLILKKGKEKPLLRGHPWIFSGAVEKLEGEVTTGEIGDVYSKEGQFLGRGYLNPRSQIILRLLTNKKEEFNIDFFRKRISQAFVLRDQWLRGKTDAYRLINGEGDFLPGLVIDCYGKIFVIQLMTAGMEQWKRLFVDIIVSDFKPQNIYEKSDGSTRKEEGLSESRGLLFGKEIPEWIEVKEYGCRFRINIKRGQKTGFYLDQRENRFSIEALSQGKKILDCFTYTGAFAVHSGLGGAKELTLIDSSEEALKSAEEHFDLNHLKEIPHQIIQGDAFEVLRKLSPGYDIIILDPPPFAKKKAHLSSASRGYKDLNLLAFRLLNKEGLLLTFSCSQHISWNLFQKIIFSAALDAGRKVQVLGRKGHPIDHPFQLNHPEGEYLRGILCRVL